MNDAAVEEFLKSQLASGKYVPANKFTEKGREQQRDQVKNGLYGRFKGVQDKTVVGRDINAAYSGHAVGPGIEAALKSSTRRSTVHPNVEYGSSVSPQLERAVDRSLESKVVGRAKHSIVFHHGDVTSGYAAGAVGPHTISGGKGHVILSRELVQQSGKMHPFVPLPFHEIVNHETAHALKRGHNPLAYHDHKGETNGRKTLGEEARADAVGVRGPGLYSRNGVVVPEKQFDEARRGARDLGMNEAQIEGSLGNHKHYWDVHSRVQNSTSGLGRTAAKYPHVPVRGIPELPKIGALAARHPMVIAGALGGAAGALYGRHKKFEEAKHRRDHGKFAPTGAAVQKNDERRDEYGRWARESGAAVGGLAAGLGTQRAVRHGLIAHGQRKATSKYISSAAENLTAGSMAHDEAVKSGESIYDAIGSLANLDADKDTRNAFESARNAKKFARSARRSGRLALGGVALAGAAAAADHYERNKTVKKNLNNIKRKTTTELGRLHITPEQARTAGALSSVGGSTGAITGTAVGAGVGLALKHPGAGAGIGAGVGSALGGGVGSAAGLYAGRPRKPRTTVAKNKPEKAVGTGLAAAGGTGAAVYGGQAALAGALSRSEKKSGIEANKRSLHATGRDFVRERTVARTGFQNSRALSGVARHNAKIGVASAGAMGAGLALRHHADKQIGKSLLHPTEEGKRKAAQAGLAGAAVGDAAGAVTAFRETKNAVKPATEGLSAIPKVKALASYAGKKAAFPAVVGGLAATGLAEHELSKKPKIKEPTVSKSVDEVFAKARGGEHTSAVAAWRSAQEAKMAKSERSAAEVFARAREIGKALEPETKRGLKRGAVAGAAIGGTSGAIRGAHLASTLRTGIKGAEAAGAVGGAVGGAARIGALAGAGGAAVGALQASKRRKAQTATPAV